MAERLPGGRILVFLIPLLMFATGAMLLEAPVLIQVCNLVVLALASAALISWRRLITIYFTAKDSAAVTWLSLGTFTIIAITVVNVSYSTWLRSHGTPIDVTASWFTAFTKFCYAFGFGSLYLVPLAKDAVIPPKGWISLFSIVILTSAIALVMIWMPPR